jgi:hypothetical protein
MGYNQSNWEKFEPIKMSKEFIFIGNFGDMKLAILVNLKIG